MARLTTKAVEAAKGAAGRREIPDQYVRGLYLIVQPTGSKSWAVRYRYGGRPRKHTIGSYPVFDLKQARDKAGVLLRAVSEGRDPEQRRSGSVEDVVAQFLEQHCKSYRPRSLKEARRLLRLLDRWHGRQIDSITRADIRALLARLADTPVQANRLHAHVSKLFKWAVANDILVASPVAGIGRPAKEQARDRVLNDTELATIWRAADKIGYPFGDIVKLLILTGQRRGEITGVTWSELDLEGGIWTLPRERTKNGRRHEIPLSRQAAAILETAPRISDIYVFSNSGTPFASHDKGKARLDERCRTPTPWRLHDLRRTTASGLARLGVSLVVIEKVLNHTSGSFAGIVGVYQRHEYANEKRAALQQWADHVDGAVRS
jgi:integrase